MGNGNDLIMKELREIKKDGKSILDKVTDNQIAIVRVEGCIKTQDVKIDHNADRITDNKFEIGRVRDSVRNMLVKVAGLGGGIGAIAGFLASLLGG